MPITRTCRISEKEFTITDQEIALLEKLAPVIAGVKFELPLPKLCPEERLRRRLAFRNERKLYKRICDATGKEIVSIYSPDKPYRVYHQDYWWSDKWDPMEYGREFDFSKGAMEQMGELFMDIPHLGILSFATENAEYNNYVGYLKDCYYTFAGGRLENVHYSYWVTDSRELIDCFHILKCEDLYECVRTEYSTHSRFLSNCRNCHFSEYLSWCIGCTDCIASKGLENAQYVIGNIQYTKIEYEKKKLSLTETEKRKIFESLGEVKNGNIIVNSSESHGHHIIDSHKVHSSRFVNKGNDCRYIMIGENIETCIDTNFLNDSEKLYECISGAWNHANVCCSFLNESKNCLYSIECFSSSHLFLCIGLKNKSYCILNKQYTQSEYEELVSRIIGKMMEDGEWGEFFSASMSPFGYNETVAQEYYPLSREEVLGGSPLIKGDVTEGQEDLASGGDQRKIPPTPFLKGEIFNWNDYEPPFPKVEKIIPGERLPDSIEDIPDDVLDWAIECEVSGRPFRIIKQELEFYRKHNIPLPRRHPDVRHMERMKMRNPRKLFERICDCKECEENWRKKGKYDENEFGVNERTGTRGKRMITTYAPERPEVVYCEECYGEEVLK